MEKFEAPEVKITYFDVMDILTASGVTETTKPGSINPELSPDDDFE